MISYDLKDNLIDEKWLEDIRFNLTSNIFTWFIQPNVSPGTDALYNFYLAHTFYENNNVNSDHFFRMNPILDKIKMSKLIRLKANLYAKTDKIVEHAKHIDYKTEGKTALFYVNDNDGFTNLNDEVKIKSKKNRLLTFDNYVFHNSSTCTNDKYRLTIVINYEE